MLLHDALDVLTTNTDDAFVVLIRHMERNRCRHFLLHKSEALLHGLISCCHDIDVEVVLVETIENDLHIALSHYLVDFAILFATDEFLVLVGKLNLDADLVLRLRNELHLRNDLKSCLDSVIRASDGETQFIEGKVGIGVGADINKQTLDVVGVRELPGISRLNEPSRTVELTSLCLS